MSFHERLAGLKPLLQRRDTATAISAYHNLPSAIFHYDPVDEWELRKALRLLATELDNHGKRVTFVSLADCLHEVLSAPDLGVEVLAEAEVNSGLDALIDTLEHVLTEETPLDQLVAARVPADANPERDLLFLVRAGALFPFYRTSALLERMMGSVKVPSVLFFPGRFHSPAGLGFMGVLDPEHNYRARIY
jgi:hypothetical protein